jgi:hypothetical protein
MSPPSLFHPAVAAWFVQAGLEHDKSARAITTALGYNQLLATNSVEVVAESGQRPSAGRTILMTFLANLCRIRESCPDVNLPRLQRMLSQLRLMPDRELGPCPA